MSTRPAALTWRTTLTPDACQNDCLVRMYECSPTFSRTSSIKNLGSKFFFLPDILSALTREVRVAFDSESDISLSALKDLPYLAAVVQEGLRSCNPA